MSQKIPAESGTWSAAAAWAAAVLAVAPASGQTVTVRNAYSNFNINGTISMPISGSGGVNGTTTTVAGDYVVCAFTTDSSNTVTAPTGWTLVRSPTGSGTNPAKVWVFAKVMVSGDLPGPVSFTVANHPSAYPNADCVGVSVVLYQTAATPLDSSNTAGSSADSTTWATADLVTGAAGCSGLLLVGSDGASGVATLGGLGVSPTIVSQTANPRVGIWALGLVSAVSAVPGLLSVGVNIIRI